MGRCGRGVTKTENSALLPLQDPCKPSPTLVGKYDVLYILAENLPYGYKFICLTFYCNGKHKQNTELCFLKNVMNKY